MGSVEQDFFLRVTAPGVQVSQAPQDTTAPFKLWCCQKQVGLILLAHWQVLQTQLSVRIRTRGCISAFLDQCTWERGGSFSHHCVPQKNVSFGLQPHPTVKSLSSLLSHFLPLVLRDTAGCVTSGRPWPALVKVGQVVGALVALGLWSRKKTSLQVSGSHPWGHSLE